MTGNEAETDTLDRASVLNALKIAVRAPSIHNTQPWIWQLGRTGWSCVRIAPASWRSPTRTDTRF
jgi:hypothetical protein